jgi:uncharacterized RDD family membrane protein YckC
LEGADGGQDPMLCPKCQNGELDGLKSCPLCGYQALADADKGSSGGKPRRSRTGESAGMIEMDYSGHSEAPRDEPKDMPEWRQQVARRLQEIKQRRQSNSVGGAAEAALMSLPFPEPEKHSVQSQTVSLADVVVNEEKPQPPGFRPSAKSNAIAERRAISARAPRRQPLLQGQEQSKLLALKMENPSPRNEMSGSAARTTIPSDPSEVKKLIDQVVIKRVVAPSTRSSEIMPAERRALSLTRYEDKLTLLSRAFSGMVDLIIIALCVGTCIFAIDAFSGIVVVDTFSWINYCLLFLATYFVYSLFFLGTINQTVGMMITDLRVVDGQGKRPLMRQILGRLSSFVPSFLLLGAGLIWGILDRESRCLHDRLSGTHVVRI